MTPKALIATSIALILGASPSIAEAQAGAETTRVDIAAENLDQALRLLAREHDLRLVYVADIGGRSTSVRVPAGTPVFQAIEQLLDGTGLQYRRLGEGSIAIERASAVLNEAPGMAGGAANPTGIQPVAAKTLDSVIVTAQKREQRIEDIPAAVSLLAGDDFSAMNIHSPFDLSEKVPGLVANNVQGYRRTFTIRGIGNEMPDNAATKPAVAYHVDGVFMSNDYALFHDLVDIDRVEVVRGPDGTIYGNSSSGGAVNVITRRPSTDEVFGHLEGEIGNHGTANIAGNFNLPLSDALALKIGISHRSHDGFTRNVPNPQASHLNVPGSYRDLDDEDNTTLSAQLLWAPSDTFSALLSYHAFDMDINGPALKGGFDTVSDDPRVVSHDTNEFFRIDNAVASLILDWNTSAVDVKALFSRQNYDMSRRLDADRSSLTANDPAPMPPSSDGRTSLGQFPIRQHVGGLGQEDWTTTAEVNLASSSEAQGRLSWLLGAFYMDTEIDSNTRNFYDAGRDGEPVNTTLLSLANPDLDFANSDIRAFESYSVFGNLSYELSEKLRIGAGARWTRNEFNDVRCNIFNGCLTAEGRTGTPTYPSEKNDNVTYKVSMDYSWDADNMSYVSVATGVKPAASNNGFVSDADGMGYFPEIFEEEKVTAFEVGSKHSLFDRRLRFNAAAYYYDIENYLFNSAGLNLTGNGVSGGSNLPESEVYGIELESSALLTPSLRLDVSLSAAESKIRKGRLAVDRSRQVNETAGLTDPAEILETIHALAQDLTGNELPKVPGLVANMRLSHFAEVATAGFSGQLVSSIGYTHRGDYYNRVFNADHDVVPSYNLAHLNFQFVPDNSQWEYELNVQNLFDKDAVASVHTDDFFQGVTSRQLLAPRHVTLRARYRF